jgi:hypothetical protein
VHAVISKSGPLVGKTAGKLQSWWEAVDSLRNFFLTYWHLSAEVGFRTKYGAAVIAISRSGKRVQDHPGNIKL